MRRRPTGWMSDFTYVAIWAGFVYVAFVADICARLIVGWRVSRTAHAGFVLGCASKPSTSGAPPIAAARYLSIKYTERFAETGI